MDEIRRCKFNLTKRFENISEKLLSKMVKKTLTNENHHEETELLFKNT